MGVNEFERATSYPGSITILKMADGSVEVHIHADNGKSMSIYLDEDDGAVLQAVNQFAGWLVEPATTEKGMDA